MSVPEFSPSSSEAGVSGNSADQSSEPSDKKASNTYLSLENSGDLGDMYFDDFDFIDSDMDFRAKPESEEDRRAREEITLEKSELAETLTVDFELLSGLYRELHEIDSGGQVSERLARAFYDDHYPPHSYFQLEALERAFTEHRRPLLLACDQLVQKSKEPLNIRGSYEMGGRTGLEVQRLFALEQDSSQLPAAFVGLVASEQQRKKTWATEHVLSDTAKAIFSLVTKSLYQFVEAKETWSRKEGELKLENNTSYILKQWLGEEQPATDHIRFVIGMTLKDSAFFSRYPMVRGQCLIEASEARLPAESDFPTRWIKAVSGRCGASQPQFTYSKFKWGTGISVGFEAVAD